VADLGKSFNDGITNHWDSLLVAIFILAIGAFLWLYREAMVSNISSIPNWEILAAAGIIGMIGAIGYLCLLSFRFLQNDVVYGAICNGSCKIHVRWGKTFLYAIMGGAIAIIFQIPEKGNFVPIQAFVLGTTWPAIVAQVLSGSQGQRKDQIKDEIMNELEN
jgi:hypothetical protein